MEQQETEAALTEEKKQTQNSNNAPGGRTETDAVQSGNGSTGQGSIGKVYSVIAATMKENPLFTVFAVLILLLLLLAGMLWGWKKRKE